MLLWRTEILKKCGRHEQRDGWLVVFDPKLGDWDAKLRSMVLLAIVSVAAQIFNEQVFSVVIPNADRALMVQIFLMSAVFVAGTVALQYMNAVKAACRRINNRMNNFAAPPV